MANAAAQQTPANAKVQTHLAAARKAAMASGPEEPEEASEPEADAEEAAEDPETADTEPAEEGTESPEADEEEQPETKREKGKGDADARLDAATKAIEAGDKKALCKALGVSPKLLDLDDQKFRVLRGKASKLKTREAALSKREAELTNLDTKRQLAEREAERRWGKIARAEKAYADGRYHEAAEALPLIFGGDDLAVITQRIARATTGLSADERRNIEQRKQLEKDRQELEAEKARTLGRSKQQTERQKALGKVGVRIKGHAIARLGEDANELVLRELEGSWDPELRGFRLTVAQAADAVHKRQLAAAKKLGFGASSPVKKAKPRPPADAEPVSRPRPAPIGKDGKIDLAAHLARARERAIQMTEQQSRQARRLAGV
jgi:hypothetical protein